jgi:hypothetical protein
MDMSTDEIRAELTRRECADAEHALFGYSENVVTAYGKPAELRCKCGLTAWTRADRPMPELREVIVALKRGRLTATDPTTGGIVAVYRSGATPTMYVRAEPPDA